MRKVVVYELLSLDGVAEAPENWFGWEDALDAKLGATIGTQDAVILGRRTYDEWARFWPPSDIEPFAPFINKVRKYVATSRPLDPEWTNAMAIDTGLVEFVRDLKSQPGGDIGVHGSISVAQALLAANLVDELVLTFGPMIPGTGRRLLDGAHEAKLELIEIVATPGGYVMTHHRLLNV